MSDFKSQFARFKSQFSPEQREAARKLAPAHFFQGRMGNYMNYECIESKRDGGGAVEAIDHEGEGEISRVLFMGLNAEALAHEYATWKNAARTPQS